MASSTPPPTDIPTDRDRLFLESTAEAGTFRFDDAVARVFPDMLRRSIPGYSTLLHLIGVLAGQKVQAGTHIYDLGCSLGAVSLAIRHAIGPRDARLVALDNSPAMVERCRELMSADSGLCPVDVVQGDITKLSLQPSSMVVMNFTLQFAPPEQRGAILRTVADALVPGGVLVLSEKIRDADSENEQFTTQLHDAFRESNGYTQMELSRKRRALEDVLIPETERAHEARLAGVGLTPRQWFRCLHFASWVAVKE